MKFRKLGAEDIEDIAKLFSELTGELLEAGAYKIMLLTGKEAKATKLYEKLGFSDDSKIGMLIRNIPVRRIGD